VASVSTGLAELLAMMRAGKGQEPANITVNVNPTPINFDPVIQVIDRPGNFRMEVTYDQWDRIKTADIFRVKSS
jgi:hypothetical protein